MPEVHNIMYNRLILVPIHEGGRPKSFSTAFSLVRWSPWSSFKGGLVHVCLGVSSYYKREKPTVVTSKKHAWSAVSASQFGTPSHDHLFKTLFQLNAKP